MKSNPLRPMLVIPTAPELDAAESPEVTLSMWAAGAFGSVVAEIARPLPANVDWTRARTVWLKLLISWADGAWPKALSTASLVYQGWAVPVVSGVWSAYGALPKLTKAS